MPASEFTGAYDPLDAVVAEYVQAVESGTAPPREAVLAAHPDLADRCNLVIVGGDLEEPTSDESEQLALLDAVVPREDGPGRGLLLAGHRGNSTVAVWLAAARRGRPDLPGRSPRGGPCGG